MLWFEKSQSCTKINQSPFGPFPYVVDSWYNPAAMLAVEICHAKILGVLHSTFKLF